MVRRGSKRRRRRGRLGRLRRLDGKTRNGEERNNS